MIYKFSSLFFKNWRQSAAIVRHAGQMQILHYAVHAAS